MEPHHATRSVCFSPLSTAPLSSAGVSAASVVSAWLSAGAVVPPPLSAGASLPPQAVNRSPHARPSANTFFILLILFPPFAFPVSFIYSTYPTSLCTCKSFVNHLKTMQFAFSEPFIVNASRRSAPLVSLRDREVGPVFREHFCILCHRHIHPALMSVPFLP